MTSTYGTYYLHHLKAPEGKNYGRPIVVERNINGLGRVNMGNWLAAIAAGQFSIVYTTPAKAVTAVDCYRPL
jgi:hypothetical protein